jgi:hypothetical protein
VHIHGGTTGFKSDISIYYGNRNLVWYVVKNFPLGILLLSSLWIIGRNCADLPYYILLQRKGHAIIRAKIDMMKGFLLMVRKRGSIKRKVPACEIEKWIHVWCRASKS